MKGTITFGDSNVPIEIYSKAPDERASVHAYAARGKYYGF